MNQPITYLPGTVIRRTYTHGQVLCIEIGAPCDVRIRSKSDGSGGRYSVVIDAADIDDAAKSRNTG